MDEVGCAGRTELAGLGASGAYEQEPQIQEEEPRLQEPQASDIASDVAASERRREPITDRETLGAVECLRGWRIDELSPDIEASTREMVIQRVVDTLTQYGCHPLELADGLRSVTETLETKANGLWWGRGRQLGAARWDSSCG